VRITLIPTRSGEGELVDKIIDIRKPDGSIVQQRWEDTTITGITGAPSDYQPRGAGGRGTAQIRNIEGAVSRKMTSGQLDAPIKGQTPGGTIAVHIPRPGPTGGQDVDAAMVDLAPELAKK
jgi:hypothetical protein